MKNLIFIAILSFVSTVPAWANDELDTLFSSPKVENWAGPLQIKEAKLIKYKVPGGPATTLLRTELLISTYNLSDCLAPEAQELIVVPAQNYKKLMLVNTSRAVCPMVIDGTERSRTFRVPIYEADSLTHVNGVKITK
jgi:hypothetical protein